MKASTSYINKYKDQNMSVLTKLYPVILATLCFSVSIGMMLVLFPITLEARGISYGYIGLSATIAMAAAVATMGFIPTIAHKIGMFRLVVLICCTRLFAFILLPHTTGYWDWVLLAWLIGPTGAGYYSIILTWISHAMPPERKGLGIAVVTVCMTAGIGIGPIFARYLVGDGGVGFYITGLIFASAIVVFWRYQHHLPLLEERSEFNLSQVIKRAPRLFLAHGTVDFIFFSLSNFIVLFGIAYGLPQEKAALLLTAYMAGSVVCNIPLGMIADKVGRHLLVYGGAILFVICVGMLPFALVKNSYLAWGVLFFMSACLSAIYIASISLINEKFHVRNRVAANSAVSMNTNFFGMTGSFCSGIAMDVWQANGLLYSIVAIVLFFLLFSAMRGLIMKWKA
jgi:MFS family permease